VYEVAFVEGIAQPAPATVHVIRAPMSATDDALVTVADTACVVTDGPARPAAMSLNATERFATPAVVSPEVTSTEETAFVAAYETEVDAPAAPPNVNVAAGLCPGRYPMNVPLGIAYIRLP
jgi:hypothetical protein